MVQWSRDIIAAREASEEDDENETTDVSLEPSSSGSRRRRGRGRALLSTIASAALTLLFISVVTFGATNINSSLVRASLAREVTQEQIDAFKHEWGLDQPLPVRYVTWMSDFVTGDFGVSVATRRPVKPDIMPRFQRTVVLSVLAVAIALPLSILIGIYIAKRPSSRRDLGVLLGTTVVAAIPEFVVGIMVILVFAVRLGVIPVDSSGLLFGGPLDQAKAYVPPLLTLTIVMMPYLIRMTREAVREELSTPYVEAATLRGLPYRLVMWRHVMPNAAIPLVNAVALNILWLLGGVIVIENVFGFPGIGQRLVFSIGIGDTITVQAIAMILGAAYIAINLFADVAVTYLNPRLRAER